MSEENKNDNKRKIIKYFGRDCYHEETENEKIITEIRTKENQKIVTHVFPKLSKEENEKALNRIKKQLEIMRLDAFERFMEERRKEESDKE